MPEFEAHSAGYDWTDQPFWLKFVLIIAVSAISAGLLWPLMAKTADAKYYIAISEGNWNDVFSPFSKRLLHPLLAHLLTYFGVSLDVSFRIWAVIGLISFPILLTVLLKRTRGPSIALLLYIASPAIVRMFTDYYMCDLLHACVAAIYLVILSSRYRVASASVIPLLFLIRESTLVLGVIVLLLSLVRRDRMLATVTFLGIVVGLALSSALSARGGTNIHHIPEWLYYVLKTPNNLAWNVMGLRLWTNTQTAFNHCNPAWTVELPRGWPTGSIRRIGYCFFDDTVPLRNLCTIMSTFGILPTLIMLRPRQLPLLEFIRRGDLTVSVAALYGSLALLLSILGGNDVPRYVTYAWPLFFISLPVLYRATPRIFWRFVLITNVMFTTVSLAWHFLRVSSGVELMLTTTMILTTYGLVLRAWAVRLRPEFATSAP